MFGFFRKKLPPTDTIIPRIKHTNFLLAMNELAARDPQAIAVTEPLVGDLLVTYSFDLPHGFQIFTERDLEKLSLTREQLRMKAMENLRKKLPPVQRESQPPLTLLSVGNNLDACLLLIDEIWAEFQTLSSDRIIVAVPTRDIVLMLNGDSKEGLTELREIVTAAHANEPVHGLTTALLAREGSTWTVFSSNSAPA